MFVRAMTSPPGRIDTGRADTGRVAQARRRFVPSMRRRLDLEDIYADARRGLPESSDGQAPLPVPETCPVTLDKLLARG